jgi:hypothetical protein
MAWTAIQEQHDAMIGLCDQTIPISEQWLCAK